MRKLTRSSMAGELFVDSSGFFALLAQRDVWHAKAEKEVRRAKQQRRRLVTTDYVLDETATLLKAHGAPQLCAELFDRVFHSAACQIQWMDTDRFRSARTFFLKHSDQSWSFTDCVSFCVMKNLGLRDALTTDQH